MIQIRQTCKYDFSRPFCCITYQPSSGVGLITSFSLRSELFGSSALANLKGIIFSVPVHIFGRAAVPRFQLTIGIYETQRRQTRKVDPLSCRKDEITPKNAPMIFADFDSMASPAHVAP
uniref:Bm14091 n=1 Tax=Brugia malayi TaxID=6279 RepID=A0A1I9FZK4_BRUMA|nr:Bm14091 [Brugia malayi]